MDTVSLCLSICLSHRRPVPSSPTQGSFWESQSLHFRVVLQGSCCQELYTRAEAGMIRCLPRTLEQCLLLFDVPALSLKLLTKSLSHWQYSPEPTLDVRDSHILPSCLLLVPGKGLSSQQIDHVAQLSHSHQNTVHLLRFSAPATWPLLGKDASLEQARISYTHFYTKLHRVPPAPNHEGPQVLV